jgi:hypothetical protein
MKTKRQKVTDMSCAAIDIKPISYTWMDHQVGDGVGEWEWWEAVECQKCGKFDSCNSGGGDTHDRNGTSKCHGQLAESEGPMMSYYYPLPSFPDDIHKACLAIKHLPLVIVQFEGDDDNAALALSGGGMDLSWEICEAFMRLGYLPPTHFELPRICGRGTSSRDRWIARAYRRACASWLAEEEDRAVERGRGVRGQVRGGAPGSARCAVVDT